MEQFATSWEDWDATPIHQPNYENEHSPTHTQHLREKDRAVLTALLEQATTSKEALALFFTQHPDLTLDIHPTIPADPLRLRQAARDGLELFTDQELQAILTNRKALQQLMELRQKG